ncbi:MAG TPA: hypothetical protein VIS06_12960 [Mycobacteriales bacterium]
MDGYTVDPALLRRLGRSLQSNGESLDSLGAAVPDLPDAGEVSGEMAELVGLLTGAAGELSIRLRAAGDAVARGGAIYADAEEGSYNSVQNVE